MTCSECAFAKCAGNCVCRISASSVAAHVALDFCPHPKGPQFGSATKPDDWQAEAAKYPTKLLLAPLPPKTAGPGDLIEWAAKYTGAIHLARLYEWVTGEPCNCKTRRDKLNAWWASIKAAR